MKKFKFNLESVLKYRENTENNEKSVLANLHAQLAVFVQELAHLRGEYSQKAREFNEQAMQGISVTEIRSSHAFMKNIEYGIELKLKEIEDQTKLVERQTEVVVCAMQDTKTLDRLKEQRFDEYAKTERKVQEKFVEEFVSNKVASVRMAK